MRLARLHREVKPKMKRMQRATVDLKALSEVPLEHGHLLHDDTAISLVRCEYLSAVLPRAEAEAQIFLSEARLMAEADSRKARAELSGQMLDFINGSQKM